MSPRIYRRLTTDGYITVIATPSGCIVRHEASGQEQKQDSYDAAVATLREQS